jgi:hypothetical protein
MPNEHAVRATTFNTMSDMAGEGSVHRDALLETFAADLTLAAYRVALQARPEGTWLDLELALWKALAEKVKTWGQENGLGAAHRGCCSYSPGRELP